jgi:hypothetical protein
MRRGLTLIVAMAAAGVPAGAASAASVRLVDDKGCHFRCATSPHFSAAADEVNDVTLESHDGAEGDVDVILRDAGSTLSAGYGCRAVDSHTVDCNVPEGVAVAVPQIRLGDGDDRLDASGYASSTYGVEAYGGSGTDSIAGGPGNDYIHGGPDADVLDGADGVDTAVFDEPEAGLRVELGTDDPQGAPSAQDRLRNVENVTAVKAVGVVLVGDAGPNELTGGPGSRLDGREGDDVLYPGPSGFAIGGAGNDVIEAEPRLIPDKDGRPAARELECGPGKDLAEVTHLFDLVSEDCEFISPDGTNRFSKLRARPARGAPFATLRYFCGPGSKCPLALFARLGSPRGTIVMDRRVSIPGDARDHFYAYRLNKRGRTLLRERGRLRVIVYYREHYYPDSWEKSGFSMTLRR